MEIGVQRQGSHIAVTIDGNIDTEGGQQLAESLADLSKMEDVELVTFDMSAVRTTTSSAIGKLMSFYKKLGELGARMEIRGISDVLHEQFTEIHLDKIIPIHRE